MAIFTGQTVEIHLGGPDGKKIILPNAEVKVTPAKIDVTRFTTEPEWRELLPSKNLTASAPLTLSQALALEVLYGEPDAVWPLIDSILEERSHPAGYPTSVEMLEVIREYMTWYGPIASHETPLNAITCRMRDIVARAGINQEDEAHK